MCGLGGHRRRLEFKATIEGQRKVAGAALEIGEDPISIFAPYELEAWLE